MDINVVPIITPEIPRIKREIKPSIIEGEQGILDDLNRLKSFKGCFNSEVQYLNDKRLRILTDTLDSLNLNDNIISTIYDIIIIEKHKVGGL